MLSPIIAKPSTKRTPRCALCNREIKPGSRHVTGLGQLGPECHHKVAGLEPMFEQLATMQGYASRMTQVRDTLKNLGFKAKLAISGTDGISSLYRVFVTGTQPKFKNFKVQRELYVRSLEEASRKRAA